MTVQFRPVPITLPKDQTAIAAGDAEGRLLIAVDPLAPLVVIITPPDLTAYGRVVYRTAAPTFYEDEAAVAVVPRVVEVMYVQLGKTLVNAGPLYLIVVDKVGAVVAGNGSAVPIPRMAEAGDMIVWEPTDGFLFTTGIRVIVSADPNIYVAPASPEPISVACRTRNP